jgi:CRISPR-associated protein Csd1
MLNHVVDYAKKHVPGSEPGFTMRPIHWLLHISSDGQYINIEPYGEKNRGKQKEVRCPDMRNMRAGKDAKRAHFLVENTLAAALYIKDKKSGFMSQQDDKAVRRNAYFQKLLHESAAAVPNLKPAAEFFSSSTETERLRQALGSNSATANDWLMFRIGDFNPLQDDAVLTWWKSWLANDLSEKAARSKTVKARNQTIDLVSGELVDPKDRHPPLKGLEDVGGNKSGTPLVCFDKDAFGSYGLKDGENASMSAVNAQLYADGLTHLLKSSHRIAGARVAYWYRRDVSHADDPMAWLTGLYIEEQMEAGALASAKDLLRAIDDGKKPSLLENQFFAMTLSGAAGRAMVRDWMEGDFRDLVSNINNWFSDLEVVAISGKKPAPEQKLETIVTSLLVEKKRNQKYEDWVKPIGPARRQLLHSAIQHQKIPHLILNRLAALLPAFMSSEEVQKALFPARDRSEDDSAGLIVSRLYARMGLIKAYFVRRKPGGDTTMTATYNPNHPAPAYHCGALLALLANLQRAALGDVGAGVVQRVYAAARPTPGLMLGRLAANARNHLAKLEPKLAWWYEERIAEIMSGLGDAAPRILDLEGQGLFALGYYQKLAQLRAGNKSTTDNTSQQQV